MKKSVVLLLTTLATLALVPAVYGIEQGRANALQRFADKPGSGEGRTPKSSETTPAAIARLVDDINAAARRNKQRMLSIIVINTDVAASTLEQEQVQHGLTLGDVYVAHSLSLATKKKFSAIAAMHKSGKSWAQIAKTHGVTLKGSRELLKEMQGQ